MNGADYRAVESVGEQEVPGLGLVSTVRRRRNRSGKRKASVTNSAFGRRIQEPLFELASDGLSICWRDCRRGFSTRNTRRTTTETIGGTTRRTRGTTRGTIRGTTRTTGGTTGGTTRRTTRGTTRGTKGTSRNSLLERPSTKQNDYWRFSAGE